MDVPAQGGKAGGCQSRHPTRYDRGLRGKFTDRCRIKQDYFYCPPSKFFILDSIWAGGTSGSLSDLGGSTAAAGDQSTFPIVFVEQYPLFASNDRETALDLPLASLRTPKPDRPPRFDCTPKRPTRPQAITQARLAETMEVVTRTTHPFTVTALSYYSHRLCADGCTPGARQRVPPKQPRH